MKHHYLPLCLALSLIAGCSSRATLLEWRGEVERFVATQGNGDLNALRDTETPSGRRVFAIHGGSDPESSTDIVGVLLGSATISDQPAYVFLVATVDRGVPEEARVVTLSRPDRKLVWRIGRSDDKALSVYRRGKLRSAIGTVNPRLGWPRKEDAFDLESTPSLITVTERLSGAQWKLAAGKLQR